MRIRDRLIFILLATCLSCSAMAQPAASLFRAINRDARDAKAASRYADAERIYVEGINNKKISSENRSTLVLNYVDLCFTRGDYQTARTLLEDYSPITKAQSQRWMVRKATANYFSGNYDEAEKLYAEANALDGLDLATRYELMAFQGAMYMDLGIYDKALAYFDKALLYANTDNLTWNIQMGKAIPLAQSGHGEEAIQLIDKCIAWFARNLGKDSRNYQVSLRKKAEILLLQDRYKEAVEAFRKYVTTEKEYTLNNFASKPEQWRLDFWKAIKPNISKVFALENHCPDYLLDVALFRREVAMSGNSNMNEINKRLSITGNKLRAALKEHECAIDFVRYTKNDTARYGAIVVPSLKMRQPVRFVPLWTEEDLHGYMVDGVQRLDDALCSSNMSDKDRLYTDTCLTHFVWGELDSILETYDYEDIYFAPDGILHLLALEYLRDDNGVCLHRLTTLSHLVNRNAHKISDKSRMLAAGGLDYNQDAEPSNGEMAANHDAMDYLLAKLPRVDHPFTYLNGAMVEIDSISRISPFVTSKETIQFERQLKENIQNKSYNVLHLSTHGYALDVEVPLVPEALRDSITEDKSLLASGIALTSANVAYKQQSQEDGIISAREFCEMDMSHIDLMVLSACQTGLGRFNDEGPAGLVRGLKKAGAGALIVSLWSVSDEATMLFMKHLYKSMSEQTKLDIHAAFNAARISFSKECRKSRSFNAARLKASKSDNKITTFNLPRYCNSFILLDAIN